MLTLLNLMIWAWHKYHQRPFIIAPIRSLPTAEDMPLLKHPSIFGVIITYEQEKHPNAEAIKQITDRVKAINPSLKICIDHEGGKITRFKETTQTPFLGTYLDQHPPDKKASAARHLGSKVGRLLKRIGIDMLLGPVVDLRCVQSPLESRAISHKPEEVLAYSKAYIEGVNEHGVETCIKHYPGLGEAIKDTHQDMARIPLNQKSIAIFEALSNHSKAVMLSHAICPEISPHPTSLSNIALPFTHIITDDITMGALDTYGSISDRLNKIQENGTIAICMDSNAIRDFMTK